MEFKRSTNSLNMRYGRYVQGGDTDKFNTRLGWWERRELKQSTEDSIIILDARTHRRPDLVAYDMYGNVQLTWLVLQYNNIVDIETEFVEGAQIKLPSEETVMFNILTKNTK